LAPVSPRSTASVGPGQLWFDTTRFAAPAALTFGNLGRNILNGPGVVNLRSQPLLDRTRPKIDQAVEIAGLLVEVYVLVLDRNFAKFSARLDEGSRSA
jgi:hypothetical protein